MDMTAPLLDVEDLRVTYRAARRTVEAVRGASFRVERGRCMGVVGESGSGKSSMARAILALEERVSGRIRFDGLDVLHLARSERLAFRRRAQMVFQDPMGSLNPRLKVGAVLEEVLRVHGMADSRAAAAEQTAEWLNTMGLDPAYADRFPHELSGGQRQRVNLARALCVGAEFLVADEPVGALDVSVQAQILNLLHALQRSRGITWILIGHDLAVVRHMADEVIVMKAGEVLERGPSADVLAHPTHPYTRELIEAAPRVESALSRRFRTGGVVAATGLASLVDRVGLW
jgi:peptide/nickel transport system ATP-binding protein